MGVLDSIIRYKQLEQNESLLDQRAMESVLGTIQKREQTSTLLGVEKEKMRVDLAGKGLKFGERGEIVPDESILSTMEKAPTVSGLKGDVLSSYLEGEDLTKRETSVLDEILTGTKGASKTIEKEIRGYQEKAAKEGWDLEIDADLSPEEKLKTARRLFAEKTRKKGPEKKEPSWGQEQKIEAVRSGLERGKIVLGKEWGEPSIYEPKTMDEALSAITEAKLDPELFQEELKRYEEVTIQDKKGKFFTIPSYQLEDALNQGYVKAGEQEKETRVKDGVTYEKRKDGLWHPITKQD